MNVSGYNNFRAMNTVFFQRSIDTKSNLMGGWGAALCSVALMVPTYSQATNTVVDNKPKTESVSFIGTEKIKKPARVIKGRVRYKISDKEREYLIAEDRKNHPELFSDKPLSESEGDLRGVVDAISGRIIDPLTRWL